MRTMWILATETLCQGVIPSLWEGDGKDRRPVLFDSQADAEDEMLDGWRSWNDAMRDQRVDAVADLPHDLVGADRFAAIRAICEDHQLDDEPMDWPMEVQVTDDGIILHPDTGMPWPIARAHCQW